MREVVYACNNNYVEQTIISMVSLLENNCVLVKFWIVSDGITSDGMHSIIEKTCNYDCEIEFLEIKDILNGIILVDGNRHPKTIYAKLFLQNFISSERVLYLDSDTVINGDLSEIWNRKMDNELVAGIQMPYSDALKQSMNIEQSSPYICDGVVLLNLSLWRKHNIDDECRKYIDHYQGEPPMLSEGTLNYVCQGRIGVLLPKYNLMPSMIMYTSDQIKKIFEINDYYTKRELEEAKCNPKIIHFIKELYNRPWYEPCDHPYKMLYRKVREMVFGHCIFNKCPLERHTQITRLLIRILPFELWCWLYQKKHRFRKVKDRDYHE